MSQLYFPNKYATFNNKDSPWLNDHIKKKNAAIQKYLKDGKTKVNYTNLQTSKAELTDAINLSKNKCFKRLGDNFNNPSTSSKIYCSIIKTSVNGKKTPIILHLLFNDKLVSKFVEKSHYL